MRSNGIYHKAQMNQREPQTVWVAGSTVMRINQQNLLCIAALIRGLHFLYGYKCKHSVNFQKIIVQTMLPNGKGYREVFIFIKIFESKILHLFWTEPLILRSKFSDWVISLPANCTNFSVLGDQPAFSLPYLMRGYITFSEKPAGIPLHPLSLRTLGKRVYTPFP